MTPSAEARADETAPAGPAEQPSLEWAPAGTAPNQNRSTSLQAAIVGKVSLEKVKKFSVLVSNVLLSQL